MANKNTVPTVANGDSWSAAQHNTFLRDNIEALWPYVTAGDIAYAAAANQLGRLSLGAAKKILSSTGSAPAWSGFGGLGFTVDWHSSAAGHSYGTAAWRDMPNSSKNVTVNVQSTLFCIGYVSEYATDTPNLYGFFDCYFHIDGQDTTGLTTSTSYAKDNTPKMVIGYKSAVAAGSRVIKFREYCGAGSYAVTQLAWMVAIIPDGS